MNYSLLIMGRARMMKMATGEGFPPPAGCRNGSRLVFGGYRGLQRRNSRSIFRSGSFRVRECNAPDSMRQVSASYSPLLPCHLLASCILPCHHLHIIRMFFKTCIRSGSPGSLRCPFGVQTSRTRPSPLSDLVFMSRLKTFSKWTEVCQVAFV